MSRSIIVVSLLLAFGCNASPPAGPNANSRVLRSEWLDGHQFVVVRESTTYGVGAGVTHHPDCPKCQRLDQTGESDD